MVQKVLKHLTKVGYLKSIGKGSHQFQLGEHGHCLLEHLEQSALQRLDDKKGLRSTCHRVDLDPSMSASNAITEHIANNPISMDCYNGLVRHVAFRHASKHPPTFTFSDNNKAVAVDSESSLKVFSFISEADWKYRYLDLLRARRMFWKQLVSNPWNIRQEQFNATTEDRASTLNCTFEDQAKELGLEEQLCFERMHVLPNFIPLSPVKTLETEVNLSAGTLMLLLDAYRKRLFNPDEDKKDNYRMSLDPTIAPFQVGFHLPPDASSNLKDLTRMFELLLLQEGIRLSPGPTDDVTYSAADALGVPYTVVLGEASLVHGVVRVRDRESCWFEEVHAAHLCQKMVRILQKRDDVKDTWTVVKKEFGIL